MPIRILMLCGWSQNATILKQRMKAITDFLVGDDYELVFIDPPHIYKIPPGGNAAHFDSSAINDGTRQQKPRTWFLFEGARESFQVVRLEETLQLLRYIIETQGPFDSVWGFSQGAVLAGMLAALMENPTIHPVFADMEPEPFKFAILTGGFLFPDLKMRNSFFSRPIKTPTLHVLGRTDKVISSERSLFYAKVFETVRIEWHDGGHKIPSTPAWRQFFKRYIDSFGLGMDWKGIPSPSSEEGMVVEAKL